MRVVTVIILIFYSKLSVGQNCQCDKFNFCDQDFIKFQKRGELFFEKGDYKKAKESFLNANAIAPKSCVKYFLNKIELMLYQQKKYKNEVKKTASNIIQSNKENAVLFILPRLREIVNKTDTFYLAENEVTQKEWSFFCTERNIPFSISNPEHPITNISWNEANEYCDWLSSKTGRYFRLPTEEEWIFALGKIPSSKLDEFSWAYDSSKDNMLLLRPIKSKKPNSFGLYDMLGNASEWTMDWYNERINSLPITNDDDIGNYKLVLGCNYEDELFLCKEIIKKSFEPTYTKETIGFRICSSKHQ